MDPQPDRRYMQHLYSNLRIDLILAAEPDEDFNALVDTLAERMKQLKLDERNLLFDLLKATEEKELKQAKAREQDKE